MFGPDPNKSVTGRLYVRKVLAAAERSAMEHPPKWCIQCARYDCPLAH